MARIIGRCGHTIRGPIHPTIITISSYDLDGKYAALVCDSCRERILKIMGYNENTELTHAGGSDRLPAKEKESNGRKHNFPNG